jgi:serine phosphatase RsbU (regulator of sigma subunit)
MPLGIFQGAEFAASGEIGLHDGDLLTLLTDGATEAQNAEGDFFEAERVLDVVASERRRCAREIVERLHTAIERFAQGGFQHDDITAVVCRVGDCA